MIKTGLPYNMGDMDEIKNNGAIVDMSDIQFPNITADKNQRTTFIFFRNTGFDVKLDFSSCSFEEKEAFLLAYLTENIDVKQSEFVKSYIKILNRAVGNDINVECILTDVEIEQFVKKNYAFITSILKFINSLPVFAMFYFSLNGEVYDMEDFEKTDENIINDNFYYVISADEAITLFDHELQIPPMFYNQLFTFENEKLFHAVQKLPFFSILHGLCTTDTSEWETVIQNSNSLINGQSE